MALSGKLFREITLADVQELVTSRIAEDTIIEYKRQALHPSTPPKQLDDEKDELLTDLISLANASGGHVFFGIETDSQERASGFVPMSGARAKALANQLRDTCGAHIKPTIENVEIQPFCLDDKKDEWLVIVVIPASARKPHMSAFRHQTKFFIRLGNAKRAMTSQLPGSRAVVRSGSRGAEGLRYRLFRYLGDWPCFQEQPLTFLWH